MAKFAYHVHDSNAQDLEGLIEADSEEHAQQFLIDQGYTVLTLHKVQGSERLKQFFEGFQKINAVQFNFFIRQMATLLKAGVPMLTSLKTLQDGVKDPVLKKVIGEVYIDVEKGTSFSESISRHPRAFDSLFIATVRSGEAIGELDTVLNRLATILEKDYQTRMKVKSALRYPMLAFSVLIVAFLIATLFIIPQFKTLFDSFGAELPLPTRMLIGASDAMINYWYLVILAVIGGIVGVTMHYKTHHGRRFWDALLLRIWNIGDFIRNAIFSRFARMLGLMLQSGVNILPALELIADIVGNSIVSDAVLRIKQEVAQGDTISNRMRSEGLFPILMVQVVQVGEESGKMDELLIQVADFYDAELEIMTKNMETMIEPFFIFVLAGFVTIMALGIFLPMWNLYSVIQQSAN